jgi:hypothetical protein
LNDYNECRISIVDVDKLRNIVQKCLKILIYPSGNIVAETNFSSLEIIPQQIQHGQQTLFNNFKTFWFAHDLRETWLGNNVSWFVHL